MRKLPQPKPYTVAATGQFVEALRRPADEQLWNLTYEMMRVESQLPSFALGGALRTRALNHEWIFLYEVPFVLPIRGTGN